MVIFMIISIDIKYKSQKPYYEDLSSNKKEFKDGKWLQQCDQSHEV